MSTMTRPPVPAKTKAAPVHRSRVVSPCDRCGAAPGECRWAAGSRSAERVRPELRLCTRCVDVFRSFLANGRNKGVRS
jgi:hypothetical protein